MRAGSDAVSQPLVCALTGLVPPPHAGFVFDIIECIVQRDFTYITQDGTTTLYEKIKRALEDPDKKKVVLLAHSQVRPLPRLISCAFDSRRKG